MCIGIVVKAIHPKARFFKYLNYLSKFRHYQAKLFSKVLIGSEPPAPDLPLTKMCPHLTLIRLKKFTWWVGVNAGPTKQNKKVDI